MYNKRLYADNEPIEPEHMAFELLFFFKVMGVWKQRNIVELSAD